MGWAKYDGSYKTPKLVIYELIADVSSSVQAKNVSYRGGSSLCSILEYGRDVWNGVLRYQVDGLVRGIAQFLILQLTYHLFVCLFYTPMTGHQHKALQILISHGLLPPCLPPHKRKCNLTTVFFYKNFSQWTQKPAKLPSWQGITDSTTSFAGESHTQPRSPHQSSIISEACI